MAADAAKPWLSNSGPHPGVKYPLVVPYCGLCGFPIEYCEFCPQYDKCKEWLKSNLPDEFEKMSIAGEEGSPDGKDADGEEKKKRQTRGGKAIMKAKKKVEPQGIKMWTQTRGKKKKVTIVVGLASYEIDLKTASKFFAGKFSCGSSISGEDEIVIQGDVKDDLWDILTEKWKIIEEDDIEDMGDKK